VEEEAYLLELVRYIHLNPVRAGLVNSLTELDRYRMKPASAMTLRVKYACPWEPYQRMFLLGVS
jgi:putative transposase